MGLCFGANSKLSLKSLEALLREEIDNSDLEDSKSFVLAYPLRYKTSASSFLLRNFEPFLALDISNASVK